MAFTEFITNKSLFSVLPDDLALVTGLATLPAGFFNQLLLSNSLSLSRPTGLADEASLGGLAAEAGQLFNCRWLLRHLF